MAYELIEASTDDGSPVNLFEFIYGDAPEDVFRYATTSQDITVVGRVWEAYNITHGDITSAGSLDRAELNVTVPSDIPLAQIFLATPPSREVLLNIWRGHAIEDGFDDFIRIWTGRVLNPTWQSSEIELSCEPVATSLKRIGLRRYYQYGCPHLLYGPICRVSRAAYTSIGLVSRIVSSQTVEITLTAVMPGDFTPSRLVGGTFSHDPNSGLRALRTITAASAIEGGVRITLMSSIPNMRLNAEATLAYGCKHNWNACVQYANTANYGGFPNIPTKDPYRTNTF